jgi:cell division protease FtsH
MALSEEDWRLLAFHEGGHAVVAAVVPNADPLHKVTIIPRGRSMGVTQQLPERDKYIFSRAYLLDRLSVMMGGRAAEDLIFDTASSGAEQDFKQAMQLARKMVLDWGMGRELKNLAFGSQRQHVFLGEELSQRREHSEHTARTVDREVQALLQEAFERARTILELHREALERVARRLVEDEEIPGSEVLDLLRETSPTAS